MTFSAEWTWIHEGNYQSWLNMTFSAEWNCNMSTFLHIPNLMIENFQKMGRFHPDFGVVAVLHQSRLSSQPVVAELGSLSPKKSKISSKLFRNFVHLLGSAWWDRHLSIAASGPIFPFHLALAVRLGIRSTPYPNIFNKSPYYIPRTRSLYWIFGFWVHTGDISPWGKMVLTGIPT